MDIGEGELNRLGVIRALPNACGANMLCRAVSSKVIFKNPLGHGKLKLISASGPKSRARPRRWNEFQFTSEYNDISIYQ